VSDSPIAQLLEAVDRLDAEAVSGQMSPEGSFQTVDGRRASGREQVRALLSDFLGALRSTKHVITAEWHFDDAWIAEVTASYELQDYLQVNDVPRVFVLRMASDGIGDLRAYGAHERPLSDHRTGEEGMWVGTRWIPPL